MSALRGWIAVSGALALSAASAVALPDDIDDRARKVHESAILIDGHNDLPWSLRSEGDIAFGRLDISKSLPELHTDLARIRQGGLKGQFWSVYIPADHPEPARTVAQQIDIVERMVERYPDSFAIARTADDIERIAATGKVASLLGIEGGAAIENDLALLRTFARLGVRYMTLTHSKSLDWCDSATDAPRSGGLSPFGERVVKEMNRAGMLVDISHISADAMRDVLRVTRAPVIASHSSAFALCPHPRNVPDDVLSLVKANGGVIMVNFYSGFILPDGSKKLAAIRDELKKAYPDESERRRAMTQRLANAADVRGTLKTVADHIDHIVKVAGIDHVGIGSDFDGIDSTPIGLEDVSHYPRLTVELLRRGYSDDDVRKILGGNVLRAFRKAGEVAKHLQATEPPDVDQPRPRDDEDH